MATITYFDLGLEIYDLQNELENLIDEYSYILDKAVNELSSLKDICQDTDFSNNLYTISEKCSLAKSKLVERLSALKSFADTQINTYGDLLEQLGSELENIMREYDEVKAEIDKSQQNWTTPLMTVFADDLR